MILQRENVKPILNPTDRKIKSELQRIRSHGKSSFVSLH